MFIVIYLFIVKQGQEDVFINAWSEVTLSYRDHCGSLGSRLNKKTVNEFIAYAQWPSRESWEKSQDRGPVNEEASALMAEAVEKSFDPIPLKPVRDLLG